MARIRIYEKVFTYSVLFSPCIAYYFYFAKDEDQRREKLEETLRENYSKNIQNSHAKRSDFSRVLHQMNATSSSSNTGKSVSSENGLKTNDEIQTLHNAADEIFKSGKNTKKRHYKVDPTLYGTEEGASKREEYLLEVKKRQASGGKSKRNLVEEQTSASGYGETKWKDSLSIITDNMKYGSVIAVVSCAVAAISFANRPKN